MRTHFHMPRRCRLFPDNAVRMCEVLGSSDFSSWPLPHRSCSFERRCRDSPRRSGSAFVRAFECVVHNCSSKAQDLKEQLIMWQTPPEGTWQARQQRLEWLQLAMSNAKEMFLGLRRHWNLLEHQNRVTEAVNLMKVGCRTSL